MLDILCDNKNNTLPRICKTDYKDDKNTQMMESDEIFSQQHFDSIKTLFDLSNHEAVFPNHHVSKREELLEGLFCCYYFLRSLHV